MMVGYPILYSILASLLEHLFKGEIEKENCVGF